MLLSSLFLESSVYIQICVLKFVLSFSFLAMARSRMSSTYSPRPTQRRRYLEPPEMDSENDSEGVSRTNSQPDGNMSPQSTSVTVPPVSYQLKYYGRYLLQ